MKNFDWKLFAIIGVVILSLLILLLGYTVSVSNTVVRMEEQINESYSGIEIQQKHRNDSITQLVQVVEISQATNKMLWILSQMPVPHFKMVM